MALLEKSRLVLIRTSLTYKPEKRGFAPGIALKLFQDQKPSLDVSLLTGLDSHGQDYNFMAKPFSNYVPASKRFGAKVVSKIFSRIHKKSNLISISHFGNNVPRQIFFSAPTEINFESTPHDMREDFINLDRGQVLFNVYARVNELNDDFNNMTQEDFNQFFSDSELIGSIILESEFAASEFGDDQLFFRHQRLSK